MIWQQSWNNVGGSTFPLSTFFMESCVQSNCSGDAVNKNGKSVHANYLKFEKGLDKFNIDLDLINIITTVKRMKVMSDILLTNNQKLFENYSRHHVIDVPNKEDLEYLKRVPKYKWSNLRESVFTHSSEINGSIRRFSKLKMSEVDRMLIANISDKILGLPGPHQFLSERVGTNQKQSNRFRRSFTWPPNDDDGYSKTIRPIKYEESSESDKRRETDEVFGEYEEDIEEDIEWWNITTPVRFTNSPSVQLIPISPIVDADNSDEAY